MSNLIFYPGILWKSVARGIVAFLALLTVYSLVLILISGWKFTWEQLTQFWYYILSLALGFGTQFGLYSYLKGIIKHQPSTGRVLAATGATSTTAMVSCCAHYLANILPIIGISGISAFVGQYQTEIFGVGVLANLIGIGYLVRKIRKQ